MHLIRVNHAEQDKVIPIGNSRYSRSPVFQENSSHIGILLKTCANLHLFAKTPQKVMTDQNVECFLQIFPQCMCNQICLKKQDFHQIIQTGVHPETIGPLGTCGYCPVKIPPFGSPPKRFFLLDAFHNAVDFLLYPVADEILSTRSDAMLPGCVLPYPDPPCGLLWSCHVTPLFCPSPAPHLKLKARYFQ